MIEINLVPDVKQELIKAQRIRATVISFSIAIGLVSAAVVALLAVYVFGVQTVRSVVADDAIKSGSAKLSAVEDLSKTLTIQNQLTKLSTLHDAKKIDSRIFDVLGAIIPPAPNAIQVSTLTIDSEINTITIEGQAANSYGAVEVFRKTVEGAKIKYQVDGQDQEVQLATNISIGDTSYGEDTTGTKVLRFTFTFTYAKEVFAPSSKNVTVKIDNTGNATDSYLGVPKSIFVERATDLGGNQ